MGIYAVTGAASGIGQAVAEQLRAEGNEIISLDIRNADIEADLSDEAQRQSAIEAILARAPDGLDGFIPCAGLGSEFGDKGKIPVVNYFAVLDMVNALRPALKEKKGAVVLISSNSAQMREYDSNYVNALLDNNRDEASALAETLDGPSVYGGGKHAISCWMRRVSPGFAADGIRMNAVAPGYTETGMTKGAMDDPELGKAIRAFMESIPIGRAGSPEDQAEAVCFLLSEKAGFIVGSVLFVDGGHDAVFRSDRY